MNTETATAQNLPAPERKPLRFITAASLFDGHDAAINIMRRIIQQLGAEVIHLGHNRSVEDVVTAALQEDAHAIALSSYQGGHVEYFKYMVDMLKERGGDNIKIFGGGGGVIVPEEIKQLHDYGVGRIYSPQDGQKLGLEGMIKDMVQRATHTLDGKPEELLAKTQLGDRRALARLITLIEAGKLSPAMADKLHKAGAARGAPVLGITGTGGAGKSSVSDELIRRFRLDQNDQLKIAI
ncbi:MAG: cobalamin-dependent protein, partial [Stenotrophobium sp.]